jgi:hypothetical protein
VEFVNIHEQHVTRFHVDTNIILGKPYDTALKVTNDCQVSKSLAKVPFISVTRSSPVVIARHSAKGCLFNNETRVALGSLCHLTSVMFRSVFTVNLVDTLKERDALVKEFRVLCIESGQSTHRLARKHLLVADVWLVKETDNV